MEPARMPKRRSSLLTSGTSSTPLGRSQSTCRARVGVTPVRRLTSAASANFSSIVEAAAACTNLPKRVPVLANPQEGISILKESRTCAARSKDADSDCVIFKCLFGLFAQFGLIVVANENYMKKAWPVDALDARHFNI